MHNCYACFIYRDFWAILSYISWVSGEIHQNYWSPRPSSLNCPKKLEILLLLAGLCRNRQKHFFLGQSIPHSSDLNSEKICLDYEYLILPVLSLKWAETDLRSTGSILSLIKRGNLFFEAIFPLCVIMALWNLITKEVIVLKLKGKNIMRYFKQIWAWEKKIRLIVI